ncbi:MAG: hypothetical protein MK193_11330 [Lentisphaeria bacterium]|nr:hypothetical protein [Lentisphaeria bacterium]
MKIIIKYIWLFVASFYLSGSLLAKPSRSVDDYERIKQETYDQLLEKYRKDPKFKQEDEYWSALTKPFKVGDTVVCKKKRGTSWETVKGILRGLEGNNVQIGFDKYFLKDFQEVDRIRLENCNTPEKLEVEYQERLALVDKKRERKAQTETSMKMRKLGYTIEFFDNHLALNGKYWTYPELGQRTVQAVITTRSGADHIDRVVDIVLLNRTKLPTSMVLSVGNSPIISGGLKEENGEYAGTKSWKSSSKTVLRGAIGTTVKDVLRMMTVQCLNPEIGTWTLKTSGKQSRPRSGRSQKPFPCLECQGKLTVQQVMDLNQLDSEKPELYNVACGRCGVQEWGPDLKLVNSTKGDGKEQADFILTRYVITFEITPVATNELVEREIYEVGPEAEINFMKKVDVIPSDKEYKTYFDKVSKNLIEQRLEATRVSILDDESGNQNEMIRLKKEARKQALNEVPFESLLTSGLPTVIKGDYLLPADTKKITGSAEQPIHFNDERMTEITAWKRYTGNTKTKDRNLYEIYQIHYRYIRSVTDNYFIQFAVYGTLKKSAEIEVKLQASFEKHPNIDLQKQNGDIVSIDLGLRKKSVKSNEQFNKLIAGAQWIGALTGFTEILEQQVIGTMKSIKIDVEVSEK